MARKEKRRTVAAGGAEALCLISYNDFTIAPPANQAAAVRTNAAPALVPGVAFDRLVWGVPAMAREIGVSTKQVYGLLARGLPARKIGRGWFTSIGCLRAAGRRP
jgi:hypothetical protein